MIGQVRICLVRLGEITFKIHSKILFDKIFDAEIPVLECWIQVFGYRFQ